jgi:hypothetical protein
MGAEESFDVVVVGGGPSGSTTASFVAMQGHRVLLLDRETFPRYQIGESLLPSIVHGICGLLGVAEEVAQAGFMRKAGGTFRWGTSPDPWSFSFAISPHIAGPTSHAYQVERMKFDHILLRRARELGVDVREGCRVTEVLAAEGTGPGVSYLDETGERHQVRARFLVGDAACFIDPVFSSGVHLATYSALLAARSINSVLAGQLDEEQSFAEFEARYRREYGLFYEFLVSFYDMNKDDKSYFWQAKKVTRCEYSELEAFVQLVGGVASLDTALVDVESAQAKFKATSAELEESVSQVRTAGSRDSTSLYQSEIVGNVMGEGTQVQARAVLGEDTGEEPLFEGGLVPAADGLHWAIPDWS